jgi:phage N-6-adenine-methyltransferase
MVNPNDIRIADRLRPLDLQWVEQLKQSIAEIGLTNPITVAPDLTLIAGHHRLAACKALGLESVPVTVLNLDPKRRRLAEIDENLIRNELSALERGEQLIERKDIYEDLHPETKHGANGGGRAGKGTKTKTEDPDSGSSVAFIDDAADKLGRSRSTIAEEIRIAKQILPEVRDKIRNTESANSKSDLLILSALPEEKQRAVAEKIANGEAQTVREVLITSEAADYDGDEWYTPREHIGLCREVLGKIDLDPTSNAFAQKSVAAKKFYTKADDGLSKNFFGRVFMNPPYSMPLVQQFTAKLADAYDAGDVTAAIILVNNCTDSAWFHRLLEQYPVCFTRGRVPFESAKGKKFATRQGQAFFYLGKDFNKFSFVFSEIGCVVRK